jgi:hypothetical protein
MAKEQNNLLHPRVDKIERFLKGDDCGDDK